MNKVFLSASIVLFLLFRAQAIDLTFFTCSDTHYLQWASSNLNRTAIVDMMNALPGKKYPDAVGGGVVATPRGVIVPGDLIDGGQSPDSIVKPQWANWKADFGMTGTEGRLKFPVYEGYGNHDLGGRVEKYIKERNLTRSNLVAVSENGFHYAWEWDGIHFVECNLFPGHTREKGKGQPPLESLGFLRDELQKNVGDSRKPVVVVHHYMPTDGWWSDEEKRAYFDVIKDYNIILITHGHQSRASITECNGFTVLNNHYFLTAGAFAVRISKDEQTGEHHLTIAQCLPSGKWGPLTFKKKIAFPKTK